MTLLDRKTTWRTHERTESALFIDGRDYYRAFHAAALKARRSILLLGWQFDSDVQLLRGEDLPPGASPRDVQLLVLLDRLCRERPDLQIRILAWDHSVVFAFERELLQKVYFDAITCARFDFRWDDTVPLGGSHHQKVAIVDGHVAFLGSQDICQARWDDSTHRLDNEFRTSRGTVHQPYHEVQVAVSGDAARSLVELFVWRWRGATGEALDHSELVAPANEGELSVGDFPSTLPMPLAQMGLSRTIPEIGTRIRVSEVSHLFVSAIASAERFVYIESQYLTSCAIREALVSRMKDEARPKLEIVIVLPHKPEKFKEEMTIGVPQAAFLHAVDEAARAFGHPLGVYNVVAGTRADGEPLYVYIHSKLMIVDDRVFIVGSANLTNRSMAIDSEIVAAYEAASGDHELRNAIRRVRVRLLSEHVGDGASVRDLVSPRRLVERLDRLTLEGAGRLRRHDVRNVEPSIVAKAVHELTLEFLDPWDGSGEKVPPAA